MQRFPSYGMFPFSAYFFKAETKAVIEQSRQNPQFNGFARDVHELHALERQFLQGNNGGNGTVFNNTDALPGKGSKALAQGLGDNDIPSDLPCGKSACSARFPLPVGHAFNPRPYNFRNIRPFIQP